MGSRLVLQKRVYPWLESMCHILMYLKIYTEVGIAGLFCFNIALGILAIKYPRPPIPPTPAKKGVQMSPQSSKRPFGRLSTPNVRNFVSSQCMNILQRTTVTTPLSGARSLPGATAQSPIASVSYPNSPLATPSRVVHYSMPMSSSTTTLASSTSSLPPSPSPVVAAYRGKHLGESFGRKLCMSSWTNV